MSEKTVIPLERDYKRQLSGLRAALANADQPDQAINIGAGAAGIEEMMRKSGLYRTDEIRPVRELFLDSRWTLGRMLKKIMRGAGRQKKEGAARPNLKAECRHLGLKETTAKEAQRIGMLPEKEKAKSYAEATRQDVLPTIELLILVARPYWYEESRRQKHRQIADAAVEQQTPETFGPFPLIYADPPWKFEIYSEKGLERTPDQHYPTLTDEELVNFTISGRTMREIASKDAVLLMWCTSSNLKRALAIMEAWDFEYKTSAVWDKGITGLGLVFRNQHEILLYGTRGAMPGPQHQPYSVFRFPRGEHSAKPPEIRDEIERMYPDFDERTRLELFARETADGWTSYGYEAKRDAAE